MTGGDGALTSSLDSMLFVLLQSQLVRPSGRPMIECLRSFCLVKSRGLAHLSAPGPVSMMLRCVIVKTAKLVDPIEMRKTDSFGETRLVLHAPSSS